MVLSSEVRLVSIEEANVEVVGLLDSLDSTEDDSICDVTVAYVVVCGTEVWMVKSVVCDVDSSEVTGALDSVLRTWELSTVVAVLIVDDSTSDVGAVLPSDVAGALDSTSAVEVS